VTVRLIATDLDGTIVRSDGQISTRTRDALAAAEDAGLVVVFVTGRPPRWMQTISDETGHRGLAVCANGAVVYDLHTEQVVQDFPMDVDIARGITKALRDVVPDIAFAVESGDRYGHEPHYRSKFELPPDVVVAHLDELLDRPILKLLARHTTMPTGELLDAAHEVVGELAMLTTATFSETDSLLEISAPGVTKAFGLERLAAQHGITADDVVAFGDMPNDLPMLVWAGHAVAVANAHPDVMAVADEVTASNDDDGVALVIERLLAHKVSS
jgi:Cof subfamily protein (haloacid dehalogenase superfamily)